MEKKVVYYKKNENKASLDGKKWVDPNKEPGRFNAIIFVLEDENGNSTRVSIGKTQKGDKFSCFVTCTQITSDSDSAFFMLEEEEEEGEPKISKSYFRGFVPIEDSNHENKETIVFFCSQVKKEGDRWMIVDNQFLV